MNSLLTIKKLQASSLAIVLTLALLLSVAGSAMAKEARAAPGGNGPTTPSQELGPADPAELEAFLDELIGREMKENHIAGAAVSVAKDGELLLTKGYGYADVENGIPVDAEGICVLNLLFLVGTVLRGNPAPVFGVSMIYKIVLGLGVLAAVLTAGSLVYTVLAWRSGYWGMGARVHYTLVTVAAVAFVWFLNYWKLLGWRF